MGLEWVPDALARLNQYPNERFWGMLIFVAFVLLICTWLMAKNK